MTEEPQHDDLEHLRGAWIVEFNSTGGWTTRCERCDEPLVLEGGLYPQYNVKGKREVVGLPMPDWRYEGALSRRAPTSSCPSGFRELVEARDRHLRESGAAPL